MMSIGKLGAGPGAGRYYIDQVAHGRGGLLRGRGRGRRRVDGNRRRVARSRGVRWAMRASPGYEGRDPSSGLLLRALRSSSPVAGFDLTLRAPKSVSILFGVAEPEVAQRVVLAHERAVVDALGYLEREACWTRRGAGGVIRRRPSRRPARPQACLGLRARDRAGSVPLRRRAQGAPRIRPRPASSGGSAIGRYERGARLGTASRTVTPERPRSGGEIDPVRASWLGGIPSRRLHAPTKERSARS